VLGAYRALLSVGLFSTPLALPPPLPPPPRGHERRRGAAGIAALCSGESSAGNTRASRPRRRRLEPRLLFVSFNLFRRDGGIKFSAASPKIRCAALLKTKRHSRHREDGGIRFLSLLRIRVPSALLASCEEQVAPRFAASFARVLSSR
jgi:hypothetical protein